MGQVEKRPSPLRVKEKHEKAKYTPFWAKKIELSRLTFSVFSASL